jgi:S1-C subfamily serine protease
MTATYEAIMDAALKLAPGDRCRVAASLWESIGDPVQELDGDAVESVLNQREAELDHDPSQEISHEDFLTHFAARRLA